MSTISWSMLESARRNPAEFAKSLGSSSGNRFSKYMAFQLSIHEYHKQREDLAKALNYFEDTFTRNFADSLRNAAERDEWMDEIDAYSKDDKKLKLTHVESKKAITLTASGKITVGGQLPLIKMNPKGGYSIYFFSRDSTDWDQELRFPIIQGYVAETLYNVDPSEVEVGVYAIDFQRHESANYSANDIEEARKELKKIGRAVLKAL